MSEQNMQYHLGEDELPVEVYFDYQPEEGSTATYPGCAASVTLGAVDVKTSLGNIFKTSNILDCFNHVVLADIEEACMEYMETER